MARSGQKIRARNARPGDTVELSPGTSWYSDEVGQISYDDLTDKWGLIDKNPSGDTKNVICLADVSGTSSVKGTPFSDQPFETDASALSEEQIDCIWIPIPDNVSVVMHTPGATKQLGSERNAGFIGLLRKGFGKVFGRGKQEEPAEFAPTQITGLPVPLTSKVDEEPFIRVEGSESSELYWPGGATGSGIPRIGGPQGRYATREEVAADAEREPTVNWEFGDREEDGSRKTGPEWEIALDIKVLDPDGFGERQEGVPDFYSLMTKEEFEQGLVGSTTRRGPNYQDQVIEGEYRVLDTYESDQQDDVDRVLELPPVRGETWEFGDNTPTERGGPLAIYDPDVELIEEGEPSSNGHRKMDFRDVVGYPEEHLEALAGGVGKVAGKVVGTGRKLNGARVGRFASRLGGAALSGFQAATGKALEGTLAGKMLNIETKRLTMLSRVPVGETIAFTVGDDRLGVRRGDRGEVRMGSRGKDKVVYFHDTGEIVHPDQWTMVTITGKVPTPQTGTLGMGLGLFGQPGHYQRPGYAGYSDGRGWTPTTSDVQTGQQYYGEFPPAFVDLMLAIPVSHRDKDSEHRRTLLAQQFNIRIGKPYSPERKELYQRLRGQRDQVIIRRREDEPVERQQQDGRKGKAIMKILKRPEDHEDAGRYYLRIVIPAGRVPSKDQSPNGWAIYKSHAKILYTNEQEQRDEQVLLLGAMQPGSTAKRDVYMIHSGMLGADDVEASDPDEVPVRGENWEFGDNTPSESQRDIERMKIVSEVRREGEAEGLTQEEIDARLGERMEERTGSKIIEFDF